MDGIDIFIPFTNEAVRIYRKEELFRVFLLSAPLSILGKKIGLHLNPNLVSINAFHNGIGFQSIDATNPLEFYFDYFAQLFGTNIFLPEITEGNLIWNNKSLVAIGNVNRKYWSSNTFIGIMNGDQLNKYQQWILDTFIPMNNFYQFLRVSLSPLDRENIFNPLLRSSLCDDFCYASFDFMNSNLQMCIIYMTDPFITILSALVSSQTDVIPLDYNNPVQKQYIIEYYEWLESQLNRKFSLNENIMQVQTEINAISDLKERQLQQHILNTDDRTIPILILKTIESSNRNSFILYTFNKDNQPQYFQINYSRFFIGYIESNLKRSYASINLNGQIVNDVYTNSLFSCTVCNNSKESNYTCSYMNQFNLPFYFIIFIFIFFFLLFLFVIFKN